PKLHIFLFFLRLRRPRTSTLFPYTTLFRSRDRVQGRRVRGGGRRGHRVLAVVEPGEHAPARRAARRGRRYRRRGHPDRRAGACSDRKSTRLNSSHVKISYAVFCLKNKKT